jgi:threonine dehydratase
MSIVVNSGLALELFQQLGWTREPNDLLQAALGSGIPAAEIVAYLKALAASPEGMDDTQISGCSPEHAAEITAFLRERSLVGA